MNRLKQVSISYLLPILAVFVVAFSYENSSSDQMHLCKHQFALCTSALCIPQPGDPTKAVCICDVEEGPSMSSKDCSAVRPSINKHGIRTLYSAYAMNQFETGKKGMKCPSGTPWTWCLNKRCTVDPSDPKKAICICDVKRTGEWMTLGGNCDTATCNTGYWSGASIPDVNEGSAFLTKALGLEESPVKWCQATKK